jgi:fructokinase
LNPVYGAIEAGGTKFVCAVGEDVRRIVAREVFPTTAPAQTLERVAAFFRHAISAHGNVRSIGIGSFGPIYIHRGSPRYGHIGTTPKVAWQDTDIVGEIERLTGIGVSVDTDVNCALLGEVHHGAGQGLSDAIYLTVGTGIGGGVMANGAIVHGFAHPEIGHMLLPRLPDDLEFAGACPFHGGACAEGLASGPAMQQRWGVPGGDLPPAHAAWFLEGRYLSMLCANLLLTTAPRRIILGGGVMQQAHLFPIVRRELLARLNGYVDFAAGGVDPSTLIVPAMLGPDAGIAGCLELARDAAARDAH